MNMLTAPSDGTINVLIERLSVDTVRRDDGNDLGREIGVGLRGYFEDPTELES